MAYKTPPHRKLRKKTTFTTATESETSGTDKTQPAMPEKNSAIAATRPPSKVIFVPAARTPMKRNRLTVVTAKMPKGTAEPNRKKLLTRTAIGLWVKNMRTCSAGANGVTNDPPCRSTVPATRPAANRTMWTDASRTMEGPRNRGRGFITESFISYMNILCNNYFQDDSR